MISHVSVVIPFFKINAATPNRSQRIEVILQIRIRVDRTSSPLHCFCFPSHHRSQISKLVHHLKPNQNDKQHSTSNSSLQQEVLISLTHARSSLHPEQFEVQLRWYFFQGICHSMLSVIISTWEARQGRDGQLCTGQTMSYWPWTMMVGMWHLWFWNYLVEGRVEFTCLSLAFLEVGSCHTWNPRQNPFSLCIYWVRITYIDEILILDPHKCAVGEEHWPTFQNQVCWRKQLTWRTCHLRHTQGVYKGPWHSCSVHRLSKDLKTSKSTSKKCDRLQIAEAQ